MKGLPFELLKASSTSEKHLQLLEKKGRAEPSVEDAKLFKTCSALVDLDRLRTSVCPAQLWIGHNTGFTRES